MSPSPGGRSSRNALARTRRRSRNSPSRFVVEKARQASAQISRPCFMTKLLITEITRMGPAFCVIGLQRENEKIHSIRPVPSAANGWLYFPHQRGDILEFSLAPFPGAKPHIEDRSSTRNCQKSSAVAEAEIVSYLRRAELAPSFPDLFASHIHQTNNTTALPSLPP